MIHRLLQRSERLLGIEEAQAHCDIPCKIYDPIKAQLAALSVIRFMDLIAEVQNGHHGIADQAQLIRLVQAKEQHAEEAKHEVRVIWGDYFKQPQFDRFPDASKLVHEIMLAGSACKQGIERAKGDKLLALVNQFAEMFWASKDVATFTAICPYLPSQPVVYPKLA